MSLSYFDDAELMPMPKMVHDTTWQEMKTKILAAVESIK